MVVVLQGSSWERHSLYRLKEADTRCNRTPWPIPQPRPTTLSSRRAACVSKSCCCSFQHKYWEQWFVLGVRRVGRSWRWRLPPTPIVTHTWWIVNRCWRPDCRTNPSSYGGSSVTRHYQRLQRMVFVDRSCSCSSYEASRSLALLAQYSTELSFRSQHLISFQNDTLGSISAIVAILGANENKSFCRWRSNRCKMSILSHNTKKGHSHELQDLQLLSSLIFNMWPFCLLHICYWVYVGNQCMQPNYNVCLSTILNLPCATVSQVRVLEQTLPS